MINWISSNLHKATTHQHTTTTTTHTNNNTQTQQTTSHLLPNNLAPRILDLEFQSQTEAMSK